MSHGLHQTVRVLAVAVALLAAAPADAGDRLVFGKRVHVSSTAYSVGCDAGYTMANGQRVHFGAVASNYHPFSTLLRLDGPRVGGRRYFRVKDRIGWGTELDLWLPSCGWARSYGRQHRSYRIVLRRERR